MNIQRQNGIVSTITFAPFFEAEEYQDLRDSIFNEAKLKSNFSPKNHIDVFDESILTFDGYFQALDFLINVFRVAVRLSGETNINFSLRSSLCNGDYFMHKDQIYGDAVNLATRLSCCSRENELLICGIDLHIIEEFIASQHDVAYFVRSQEDKCVSLGLFDEDLTQLKDKVFQVEVNNKIRTFQPSRKQQIGIGRSDDSDIFIDSDQISRNHATITLNYENIFIQDHSSNGTFLYFDNREIFLKNDSMKISSGGFISCGHNKRNKKITADLISYLFCNQVLTAA